MADRQKRAQAPSAWRRTALLRFRSCHGRAAVRAGRHAALLAGLALRLRVYRGDCAIIGVYFLQHDPKLVERRMKAGPAAESEPAQKIIIVLVFSRLRAADRRSRASITAGIGPSVPAWLVLVANGLVALSFVVILRGAQAEQLCGLDDHGRGGTSRSSRPAFTGSSAIPMYAGALLLLIFTPLALGSYWGLLVGVVDFAGADLAAARRGTIPDAQSAGLCRLLPPRALSPHSRRLVSARYGFPPSAPSPPCAVP